MTNESIGINKIASELRESAGIIRNLIQGKDAPQLAEFVDAVENYAKYIDSIIELEEAANKALQDLINSKK